MAVQFTSASQQWVAASGAAILNNLDTATYMAWVYRFSNIASGAAVVVSYPSGDASGFPQAEISFDSSGRAQAKTSFNSGTQQGLAKWGVAVPLNSWHHLCLTFDQVKGTLLYVDGVQRASDPGTGNLDAGGGNPMYSGASDYLTGTKVGFINAAIEDLRIFSRSLSVNEILTIYNAMGKDGIDDQVLGHFPFRDNPPGTSGSPGQLYNQAGTQLKFDSSSASPFTWATQNITTAPKRRIRSLR